MYKFMQIPEFCKHLFDYKKTAQKAEQIIEGILQSQSPRISDVADTMAGEEDANYKMVQRFLDQVDTRAALQRLFNEESEYVIVDPTEIERPVVSVDERPGAKKTEYVGTLRDGEMDAHTGYPLAKQSHSLSLYHLFVGNVGQRRDFT